MRQSVIIFQQFILILFNAVITYNITEFNTICVYIIQLLSSVNNYLLYSIYHLFYSKNVSMLTIVFDLLINYWLVPWLWH